MGESWIDMGNKLGVRGCRPLNLEDLLRLKGEADETLRRILETLRPRALPADYAELGLAPGASVEDVTRARRDLARRCHPDVAGGDTDRMARINGATARLLKSLGGGS